MTESFNQKQNRLIKERNDRRLAAEGKTPAPEPEVTNVVEDAPVAEAVDVCPTCGKSGDEPCVTASGNVKSDWHSKRGS